MISSLRKVKSFFASLWEYIKPIIQSIGKAFSWIGGRIFGKVSENSPLKEFEKKKSIAEREIHTPHKNSISNNENSLLNNSGIK